MTLSIENHQIGSSHSPFIIAEMSGNHNQSLERALEIVEEAAKTGVQALKIQTYTADTMMINTAQDGFVIQDQDSLWKNQSLYDLYLQAHTPWEWHQPIFDRCKELGLVAFSTPFDETAVDFLESLNVPCYKIASFENNHLPLIKKVAKTGKPTIVSTGMASLGDLEDLVRAFRENGGKDLVLLKCTSSYPASPNGSNLNTIPAIKNLFSCEAGLSDHTLGIGVSVASIALGATVIEKHFTLSRADGGVDSAFSMEPHEMKELVLQVNQAWTALGSIQFGTVAQEKKSLIFRRSLYIAENMKAGDILTTNNLRILRPGHGLAPKFWNTVIGKAISKDAEKGTPLSWDLMLG